MTQEEQHAYDRLVGKNRILSVMLDFLTYQATPAGQQMSMDQALHQLRNNLLEAFKALPSPAARAAAEETFSRYADFINLGSLTLRET